MNANSLYTSRKAGLLLAVVSLFVAAALAPGVTAERRPQAQTRSEKTARNANPARQKNAMLQPNPNLSPEQVITIVLEALQHNDQPAPDSGIATAFRFASPGNHAATGPLDRFILLVKNPLYKPLLNYKSVERGTVRIADDVARQRVTLVAANGLRAVYLFTLSKQTDNPYKNCWMTDGVERLVGDRDDDSQQVAKSNGNLHANNRA
ncbi:MAG: DUF4864 domain-containing protein [Pyrinomonadaceae bacterium]